MTAETQNPRTARTTNDTRTDLTVRRFLDECTVGDLDDSSMLPVADLYGMYIIWCEQTETNPIGVQAFSTLVRAEGITSGISRREKVFKGVIATGTIPIQYILETDRGPGPNSALGTFSI
mgnify:CR=1 FL=1